MSKIKVNDYVKFNFAGQPLSGKVMEIEENTWGSVTHVWYKVLDENDGTKYPCRVENLTKIK